jgi:hypothetical protein
MVLPKLLSVSNGLVRHVREAGANTFPGTVITLGDPVDLSPDGRFHLSIPDLSSPPNGDLRIQAKDKATGDPGALLIPEPRARATRMGGLKILREYPAEIVFTPCALNSSQLHDSEGFALRPDLEDACTR